MMWTVLQKLIEETASYSELSQIRSKVVAAGGAVASAAQSRFQEDLPDDLTRSCWAFLNTHDLQSAELVCTEWLVLSRDYKMGWSDALSRESLLLTPSDWLRQFQRMRIASTELSNLPASFVILRHRLKLRLVCAT